MNTTVDLLDSLRAHLVEFELPAIASVHVITYRPHAPQLTVQLPRREPPQIARALLAWADTITEVTATAWRVPSGDCVHLSVTGQFPDGVSIRIYGGVALTDYDGIGGELAPDASTTVPLALLRERATPGAVAL